MYRKAWLILATITLIALLAAGATHLGLVIGDPAELTRALTILWAVTGAALLLLWAVAVPITVLWIRNLSYEITQTDVLINKGILTKVEQSIPLRMITDFRLNRSLYDRWLAIGSIDVQTAGQSVNTTGYEGRLSGLAEWARLHAELKGLLPAASALRAPVGETTGERTDDEHLAGRVAVAEQRAPPLPRHRVSPTARRAQRRRRRRAWRPSPPSTASPPAPAPRRSPGWVHSSSPAAG